MVETKPDSFANLLIREVGQQSVTVEPSLVIDGLKPAVLVKPDSAEQVAVCLRLCAEAGRAVVPAGLGTWLECGNPLRRADVIVSVERLNRIIDYSPPDLTATVQAGLCLATFDSATSGERQWLPLDPPGRSGASLGAICACASYGPLRFGFGTPRDYVIGLQLAHVDGTLSRSGGRVVKNVAGYDMNKLYVGSYGTLAVLTEITLKLRPSPERSATVQFASREAQVLAELGKQVLASKLQAASLFLVLDSRSTTRAVDHLLLARFSDVDEAVTLQLNLTMQLAGSQVRSCVLDNSDATSRWLDLANIDDAGTTSVRISIPIAEVVAMLHELEKIGFKGIVAADVGTGLLRAAFESEEARAVELIRLLRSRAEALGGTLFVERGAVSVRKEVDAWGRIGGGVSLMRDLKIKFDPDGILNPGRFAGGI